MSSVGFLYVCLLICILKYTGGGWDERAKKVKGLRSINWLLQNSHGDVQDSIGNIVAKELLCQPLDMDNVVGTANQNSVSFPVSAHFGL